MRTSPLPLVWVCVALCSCDRSPKIKIGGVGDDPTWVTRDVARAAGLQLLTNRYPEAQILYETSEYQKLIFRFATNQTTAPVAVVVDLKSGKAKVENVSH